MEDENDFDFFNDFLIIKDRMFNKKLENETNDKDNKIKELNDLLIKCRNFLIWRKVSEELPKENENIEFCFYHDGKISLHNGYYSKEGWYTKRYGMMATPSHWRYINYPGE